MLPAIRRDVDSICFARRSAMEAPNPDDLGLRNAQRLRNMLANGRQLGIAQHGSSSLSLLGRLHEEIGAILQDRRLASEGFRERHHHVLVI